MQGLELEAPREDSELYTSMGDEVDEFRPVFTGDIFGFDDGRLVIILQHPCALRRDGATLVDRILVAAVCDAIKPPRSWKGHYRLMPLPGLSVPREALVADFTLIDIVRPEELESAKRYAILSQVGVNLLLQRWIHHNTRALVDSSTINDVTIGPFDEADLSADWLRDCAGAALDRSESAKALDEWFSYRTSKKSPSRRETLANSQARSGLRAEFRRALRDRIDSTSVA
ncbi:hypothetical protein [Cellulomonas xiejunii]|uniref:Uncharacterized protein n=1 Tax=Cellulomonas xiejunii TaxID=2968083 RepID=A0ABY5KQ78_9CELL|nr:hypothetical protein [Cellulomonas xiejunii]MCC2319731.1 hypothetical protein [Cellulomonas xiejunii]UUI71331.1 hypothetical protein NP048_16285 [Cellulomonas xiejunii]